MPWIIMEIVVISSSEFFLSVSTGRCSINLLRKQDAAGSNLNYKITIMYYKTSRVKERKHILTL